MAALIDELAALAWLRAPPGAWLAEVGAFVAEHASGPLERVQVRPWAVVLATPAGEARVYFKATAPGGRHEPGLLEALAGEFPDLAPRPLACERERGWLLLPDRGRKLREAQDESAALATWTGLLPRYAELQRSAAHNPGRWLGLGVPDRRLERLPSLLAGLLDGAVGGESGLGHVELRSLAARIPELEAACRELAQLGPAASLDHGDLHDGNVLVQDGATWLLDWADACVAHPFVSLLVTSRSVPPERAELLRDAYLEPWTAEAPPAALREAFARAQRLAHVGRALDWAWMLEGTGPAARAEWLPRVAHWLREWAEQG